MAVGLDVMPGIERRNMDDGAIAGTAVGVVLALALLVFCLYPVVVHLVKRRRDPGRSHLDAEAAVAAHPDRPSPADLGYSRRLSSDSLKRDADARSHNKELGWVSHHGGARKAEDGHGRMSSPRPVGKLSDGSRAAAQPPSGEHGPQTSPPPVPFYAGEYMPESEVRDHHPGVLQGTSADYYSRSIPSEAFGMITTPSGPSGNIPRADPAVSRGSSFRYNIQQMFRRKSGRDQGLDSHPAVGGSVNQPSAGVPEVYGATTLHRIVTNGGPTESPTELSPPIAIPPRLTASSTKRPPAPSSPLSHKSSPLPHHAERSFKASPSPPSYPAPGTVNPMDIMPATTESEVWHRTEHELLVSSYGSSEGPPQSPQHNHQKSAAQAPIIVSPPPSPVTHPETAQIPSSPALRKDPAPSGREWAQGHDIAVADAQPHGWLGSSTMPEPSGHTSNPSDQSTPFPWSRSTDPSSYNTPSTQIDSCSPESMNSSDFWHNVSSQSGAPAPKAGSFPCGEPGCQQIFDQPHKLKHHQRYHSKDHKCPYPNCGKGFGTKTHLQRHINDRHEKKKFHCSVQGCDYSRAGGKAFPRKDNWKRHMTKIHSMDQAQLPEPVEIDQEMTGM